MEASRKTTMQATVCQVQCCTLCVCDHESGQKVLVHYDNACCFRPGQRVCIHFSGAMTSSIPPQISADCVERVRC